MKRTAVFRHRVPEAARIERDKDGQYLATSHDGQMARGDTPEEAADLLTLTLSEN